MSKKKIIRKHIKEEKRIITLCYKKGLLKDYHYKIGELHWNDLSFWKKSYIPEIHYWGDSYWGDSDEYPLIDSILEHLYWENIDEGEYNSYCDGVFNYPTSTFSCNSRKSFIKYLKSLPTIINNNKIRKLLKRIK